MNEPRFTPGPWEFLEAYSHDDEYSASRPLTVCSDSNDDLANVFSSNDSTVSIARDQAIANAHLIAAAPDLYEALAVVVQEWGRPYSPDWNRARAALAKARGEV